MIFLQDLSIGYKHGRHTDVVASGINAHIPRGTMTCLVGSNGSGKSTLLRTLSTFQPKLDGKIIMNGRDADEYTSHELAQTVSVVLTERPDLQNMTVRETVAIGRNPYTDFWGRLRPEDNEKIDYALQTVGIEPLSQRMTGTLSDGERQKVMIAKALAQETPIIFLDEPTAFLDYPSKVEMMQLLCKLAHECGKTIFLSTHDLEQSLPVADQIWLMRKGRPMETGTAATWHIDGTQEKYLEMFG